MPSTPTQENISAELTPRGQARIGWGVVVCEELVLNEMKEMDG